MAGDAGRPARSPPRCPGRRRARCARRPWSGARTTGCGWCARPVSCSRPRRSTRRRPASGPTVAEATAGMSPGRLQEILAAAGLPATHDPVTAVAALTALFTDRARMAALLDTAPAGVRRRARQAACGARRTAEVTADPAPARRSGCSTAGCCCRAAPATSCCRARSALHLRGGRAHRDRRAGAARRRAAPRTRSTGCGQRGGGPGVHRAGDRRGAAEGLGRGRARRCCAPAG